MTADLLRPAGHTLQQQIQDLQIDLFSQMLFTPLTLMMIQGGSILRLFFVHQAYDVKNLGEK